ncbi:uncharacterized protein MELLADRAFT_86274 [Melampsora larici-populina 98AG31]|uniref:Secreted protein n=1 Tax=Melampsora larici-populina (strain 98AG31 / pathotype 3-4-7) TaxID=747676 RepID=F4RL60_MELLP|nr:uncharacterized protein MELLADRAFT_86274 [Melampsora larici-populina 98AG31]EGG06923.1 hypothetical protein MELLADRAFT_86274 [Melampsora larici-populina 98AG31]
MNSVILFPLVCLAMFYAQVSDAQNTGCYNYFLQKDGCVWGSTTNPCPTNSTVEKPCTSLRAFHYSASSTTTTTTSTTTTTVHAEGTIDSDILESEGLQEAPKRLVRRYDTTAPTLAVAGGDGICGFYNSTITSGVCLWTGEGWVDGSNQQQSGWLNGTVTDNCNKQVYIQRQGQPETVQYAPVLDGCQFFTADPDVGCFQIWLTIDLFEKFGPTPEELSSFTMNSTFTWDFNNLNGQNPTAAPV